jgi:hypothetical protein
MFLYNPVEILSNNLETLKTITTVEEIKMRAEVLKTEISAGLFAGYNNAACEVLDAMRNRYKEIVKAGEQSPAVPAPTTSAREFVKFLQGNCYCVEFTDGTFAIIRISKVEKGKLEGKTIIERSNGWDNENGYKFSGFAFLADDSSVKVWKSYKDSKTNQPVDAIIPFYQAAQRVTSDPENIGDYTEAYARRTGKCARCNRHLKVEASINRGFGPDCWDAISGGS